MRQIGRFPRHSLAFGARKLAALVLATCLAGCTFLVGEPKNTNFDGPIVLSGADLAAPCGGANFTKDPRNCGSCGHDCSRLPGVLPSLTACVFGQCDVRTACIPGRGHCTANPDDGCESDFTAAAHCGSCSVSCSGATPLCTRDGSGRLACAGSCGTATPNVCGTTCVDLTSDPDHCGSCTRRCTAGPNQTATCSGSVCGVGCSAGFHVCSNACVDDSSVQHCASSCTPCPRPANSSATCDALFGCGFNCDPGFFPSGSACLPNSAADMTPPPDDMTLPPNTDLGFGCLPISCTSGFQCMIVGCTMCLLGFCQ